MTFTRIVFFGFLGAAGWPRTVGLLRRRRVVDGRIVVVTYREVLRRGFAIGAGLPQRAAQLLAEAFPRRDWIENDADGLVDNLASGQGISISSPDAATDVGGTKPNRAPWESMLQVPILQTCLSRPFEPHPMPWDFFQTEEFTMLLLWNFAVALVWGLERPGEVEAALDAEAIDTDAILPVARAAGVAFDPGFAGTSARAFYADCERLIASYESRSGSLPLAPPSLFAHPRIGPLLSRTGGVQGPEGQRTTR